MRVHLHRIAVALACLVSGSVATADGPKQEPISPGDAVILLFNGKDLTGNAVKHFRSRIRKNSGFPAGSLKSCDSSYTQGAAISLRKNASQRCLTGLYTG